MTADSDVLNSELEDIIAAGAGGIHVVELDRGTKQGLPGAPGVVCVGVHRAGPCPTTGLDGFDILLSADPKAPQPWIGVAPDLLDATLTQLRSAVDKQPVAAAVAVQVLRTTLALPFDYALAVESFAYSMLLASDGFRNWRAATPVRPPRADDRGPRVSLTRQDGVLNLRLTRSNARNAFDARMRDELTEALAFAVMDPESGPVVLSGAGATFSVGGDLAEFGQARDVGHAHLIRTLRAPVRLLYQIRQRVTARLHGPCIGAGIEFPAAAARVTARRRCYVRLPEVSMGLIPGAGGTATIPRRIGRQRAGYMVISGVDVDVETALAWGLIDALEPAD